MRWWLFFMIFLISCGKSSVTPNHIVVFNSEKHVNVKDFGVIGNGIDDDSQAFYLALEKAKSLHKQLYIPMGIYKADIELLHDGLQITGELQPDDNWSKAGTIIRGKINCNNRKNISVSNLGIDSRNQLGLYDDAALNSGNTGDSTTLNQYFNRISILGDGYAFFKHGILCQAGRGITIKNVVVSNFYHGIAVRSGNVNIDSVQANYCGFTSIIVKSEAGYNALTENVFINNVTIKGDPTDFYRRGGAILVQSYDESSLTNNIKISNVNSVYGGIACILIQQIKGTVSNVSIRDCNAENQGDNSTRACYDVSGGSNLSFMKCSASNSYGYAFRAEGKVSNIRVSNSFEKNSNMGAWTGNFAYLQLNGKLLVP